MAEGEAWAAEDEEEADMQQDWGDHVYESRSSFDRSIVSGSTVWKLFQMFIDLRLQLHFSIFAVFRVLS